MQGWIRLHRQIMEGGLWDSKEPFDHRSAWVDLLLLANYQDKRIWVDGNVVTVECGQVITSVRKLAERWRWGVNRVRKYLKTLESENMVHKTSTTKYTLINIVNYQKYQGFADLEETPTDTPTDTQTGTEQIHRQITNNNIKKYNKEKKSICGEYHHVRLTDSEIDKLNKDYGEQMTNDCITYLDEYIEMKGYKAKSHYLCIRKWVVDAVKEKSQKKSAKSDTWNINSDGYDDFIKKLEGG